jgi:putative SOS response-associated peptidase YedK
MCSRYSLTSPHEAVRAYFNHTNGHEFPPRPTIAPTEPVAIIRRAQNAPNAESISREMTLVRWGLLPPWVKDPKEFGTLINARAETVTEKPSFRGAIRHKRCLIPADGFYEWMGEKGAKRPFRFGLKSGGLFAMAGLSEHWLGADGSELETMAIITTRANGFMEPFHDRMPVILHPEDYDLWIDCRPGTTDGILHLLEPAPDDLLDAVEIEGKLPSKRAKSTSSKDAISPKLI